MSKFIICGMDVHEKSIKMMWAVDNGAPELKDLPNTPGGRLCLISHLKGAARAVGCTEIVVAYEACMLGFGLHDQLMAAGITCHVLAPSKIRKSRHDVKRKTDEADARLILETLRACLLAGNTLPAVWIPSPEQRADRELVRARLEIGNKTTELKTQISMLLKTHSITRPPKVGKPWTLGYRAWLAGLTRDQATLPLQTRLVLGSMLRQLKNLETEARLLNNAVATLADTPRYKATVEKLTESLMGVGVLTAMVFLTELGDLTRFKNRRQLGSYLGLAPTSNESGQITDRKGHISRTGPSRVRWALCQATWCHIRLTPEAKAAYERIRKGKDKLKRVAQTACCRQLAIRMWHMAVDVLKTKAA
jgi:transposase